jgi:adenosylmethionine-8-amino-7-oxononanoate aminotransferase
MSKSFQELVELDQQYVWHPYASASHPPVCFPVKSANGVRLTLADDKQIIDGMSSWWAAIHGYNHPILNAAAKNQLDAMSHVMFGGLTHEPAITLCQRLVELTPTGLNRVFLADSGSVSVEVAIKMAYQFWLANGKYEKNRLLTVKNGYHGDTFSAMSVCDPVNGMHHMFKGVLAQHFFVPAPPLGFDRECNDMDMMPLVEMLSQHHQNIAALIIEPIVQGAGGMRFYSPSYLKRIRELCDQYNILLIADEIATGFGRTGKLFACEHADISPDIMCLGKAITGGYMTLAATLCSDRVIAGIDQSEAGVLMHGPTFMGNPLACAVANASLDILLSSDWQQRIAELALIMQQELSVARSNEKVSDVRILGAIGVVEMNQPVDMKKIQPAFVERGVWVRPFGKLIYIMPPFVISDEDLRTLCRTVVEVAAL